MYVVRMFKCAASNLLQKCSFENSALNISYLGTDACPDDRRYLEKGKIIYVLRTRDNTENVCIVNVWIIKIEECTLDYF